MTSPLSNIACYSDGAIVEQEAGLQLVIETSIASRQDSPCVTTHEFEKS